MGQRIPKINQLIHQELAKIIQKEFAGEFVTITAVETSLDLSRCIVWVAIYTGEEERILRELRKRIPYYQADLGKLLFVKRVPKLSFVFDKSFQRAERIEKILSSG